MTINIAEILVANSCGAAMVLMLLIFRIHNSDSKRRDEQLYNCMLIATLAALTAETASFLIDGKLFTGCFALQYICNTVCTGFTALVGYLWSLFVEFKIYRSVKRLKNKAIILGVPLFAVACLIGIVVQVLFYGISTGWASIAVGFVFVDLQLQTSNSFVDDMSGLFNRKYFNIYIEKLRKSKRTDIYGIMLDVNNFKRINDVHGHYVVDSAIRSVGKILSESVPKNAVPMRMAGDEFMVLIVGGTENSAAELKKTVLVNIDRFNRTTDRLYKLSLAIDTARFKGESLKEFLLNIDRDMYSDKKEYYLTHER